MYEWLGTTMDMIDSNPAPNFNKVVALHDDGTFLVLIHADSSFQLWHFFGRDKNTEQVKITDVDLRSINQEVVAFITRLASRSYLFLAGQNFSYIYHQRGKAKLVFN